MTAQISDGMTVGASMTAETIGIETVEVTADSETKEVTAETTGTETVEVTADSETEGMTEGRASSATIDAQATTSSTTIGRARPVTTPISLAERPATDVRPHALQEPVNPPASAVSVPRADLTNEAMTGLDSIAPIKDAEPTDKAPKTGPSTPTTGPALLARTPTSLSEMRAIDAKLLGPAGGVVGNARTGDETVDVGKTGDETVDNARTGDDTEDNARTGDETVDDGKTGEEMVDDGKTGDETVVVGKTGDETVDDGKTGGEGMTDAPPPQTTAALRTIKTVSDEQKASAPDTPTTNHPEISENHVNLNAAAMTEECP